VYEGANVLFFEGKLVGGKFAVLPWKEEGKEERVAGKRVMERLGLGRAEERREGLTDGRKKA
jgi:hypothetical protein